MNSIIYDEEIITPKNNRYQYYYDFIEKLNSRDCIKFSLFCAKMVNKNRKENNIRIGLVEKWLKDENSVSKKELWDAASNGVYISYSASADVAYSAASADVAYSAAWYATNVAIYSVYAAADKINKYLQILIRKTKQFQNNKILEQISKTDVDRLELVDWNMITDIMLEEYNIVHEFSYSDIFSRRCLIELLRREYT